jgi:predicted nucleic acid-binding Zn ribbon protein
VLESPDMEQAKNILGPMLRQLGAREEPLPWLAAAWKFLVGRELAAHTRPLKLRNGLLEIAVSSPEWERQVAGLSSQIGERINAAGCGLRVEKVQVVPAPPRERNPFVRTRGVTSGRRPGGPKRGPR